MDEDKKNDEKKKNVANNVKEIAALAWKSFSPVLIAGFIIAVILVAAFMYFSDLDTANFRDKDESNVPYNFVKYYSEINISKDGKIMTKQNAQDIWDNIIKHGGNVDKYLDNASELKKLMDAQLVTQFPDTRSNPDEKIDWKDFFSYKNEENSETGEIEQKLTNEIQGIVKFKRAMADGTKKTMTYVDESTYNWYIQEYNRSGSEEDKQRALSVFTIGVNRGTSSSNSTRSGTSLAGFTTEQFLQAVRDVAAYTYENRSDFKYGNSQTTPPCEYEVYQRTYFKIYCM